MVQVVVEAQVIEDLLSGGGRHAVVDQELMSKLRHDIRLVDIAQRLGNDWRGGNLSDLVIVRLCSLEGVACIFIVDVHLWQSGKNFGHTRIGLFLLLLGGFDCLCWLDLVCASWVVHF